MLALSRDNVMTFRWTLRLAEDGHQFKGGDWRCSSCRRHAFDLLGDRRRCISPTADGEYVFVGGPLDGQWLPFPEEPPRFWEVVIPPIKDLRIVVPDELETITYTLTRPKGGAGLVYLYDR